MNKSIPKTLTKRILDLLERMRRLRRGRSGRPVLAELDASSGHARGHLRRQLNGEIRMSVDDLFRIMDLFGAEPQEVLEAARRGLGTLDLWLGETAKEHPEELRRLLQARRETRMPGPEDLGESLDQLATLQRSGMYAEADMEPYLAALSTVEEPISPETQELCFRTWELLGTSHRAIAEYSAAAYCYRQALTSAGTKPECRARLLRRACYLAADKCDFDHALFFADQAQEIYRERFLLPDLGRAWIDAGVVLFKAGRYEPAMEQLEAGLGVVGSDLFYQISAVQTTGLCQVLAGRVQEAKQSLIRAQGIYKGMSGGPMQAAGLHWLAAEISVAEQDCLTARILYERIRKIYDETGNRLNDAAVSLRLARVLLLLGDQQKLKRLARQLAQLMAPLSRHQGATAVLRSFCRLHAAGELTAALLDRLFFEFKMRARATRPAFD